MNSRRKGNRAELRIGKLLAAWWNSDPSLPRGDFRRCPLSGGWDRTRAAGDLLVPDRFPWSVEIKHREGWSWDLTMQGAGPVWDWWRQAVHDARAPRLPVLILTRNHQPDWIAAEPGIVPASARLARLEPDDARTLDVALLGDFLTLVDPVTVALS